MGKLPSVMKHDFSRVPQINVERSQFDRSHVLKTTFDGGYLVPIYVDEALPGDTFNLRMTAFARLATPIKPIMDNLYLETFFFAVPKRLLWTNWERFNGAQDEPDDSTDFEVPQVQMIDDGPEVGSLSDYIGIPTDVNAASGFKVNAWWHRAYNKIWNDWFRDQNLQEDAPLDLDDGPDTLTDYVLRKRGKRHDYFTSCLPWPQKGDDVSFSIGSTAPVELIPHGTSTNAMIARNNTTGAIYGSNGPLNIEGTTGFPYQSGASQYIVIDPNGRLQADLSSATAVTVNALREAVQLQVLLERDARGGTRYCEIVASRFGVVSPQNAILQRAEYLGGGSSPINIHPVPQTTPTTSPTLLAAQGNLAGFGTASFSGHGFNKAFVEHCVIIGLANVRADLTYQQGLNRMFSRRTRYDYFWPELAHIGEQAVLNKEIYLQGDGVGSEGARDTDVFGYQEAWAEYRYKPSQITGAFRSTYATPLDYWHLSQEFGSLPELGEAFIVDEPPIDRVIAVPSEPHIMMDAWFKLICARPIPVNSIPTLGARL